MKIEKVTFRRDMPVPKPLPGYAGSTSGIAANDKIAINWEPGNDYVTVEHILDPEHVAIFPMSAVANLHVKRKHMAEGAHAIEAAKQPPANDNKKPLRQ